MNRVNGLKRCNKTVKNNKKAFRKAKNRLQGLELHLNGTYATYFAVLIDASLKTSEFRWFSRFFCFFLGFSKTEFCMFLIDASPRMEASSLNWTAKTHFRASLTIIACQLKSLSLIFVSGFDLLVRLFTCSSCFGHNLETLSCYTVKN